MKICKLSQTQHQLNSSELGLTWYMDYDYNCHIMYTYAHNLGIMDIILQYFSYSYVFLLHNYNFMYSVKHNHDLYTLLK